MKKIAVTLVIMIICLLSSFTINRLYNENRPIRYNENEVRKIAWDSLSDDQKRRVVKTDGDLLSVSDMKGIYNIYKTDAWKYAEVGVARHKDIGSLYLVKVVFNEEITDSDIVTKVKRWYVQNYKVIRVSFKTNDALLGPITLYIDPDSKKVIGSDLLL